MNPEKRFGQIEEVLAEALIKIDRIEDLATKTFSIAETAKTNGETTARAVANLTIENQQAHQQLNAKIDGVSQQLNDKIDGLNDKFDGLNDKFDGLKEEVSQIMNFLREKFS